MMGKKKKIKNINELEKHISEIVDKKEKLEKLIELGKFYFLNEKYNDAITKFDQALKLNDKNPEIYYNLGVIYESKNDIEKAKKMYQKALELNPHYVLARQHLEKLIGV